ncbi:MAG TPA: GH1 family beta-glucosidase [Candidatus Nanopelagicaceae bacterium]
MSALNESRISTINELAKRIPSNFRMGAATSSWQIEGSSHIRGRSIWEDFAAVPGNIRDGAQADPACDHVNRWESDLDLLSWLEVDSYRFSISWPRVMPNGTGKIDHSGLAFYDRLIDGLLARNIEPVITIYHWDLPSALEEKGGWNWEGISEAFAQYTEVLAKKFVDRTAMWATLNEPWCSAFLGYADKVMAPGKGDPAAGFEAAYRLLVAHAHSVEVLRQYHAKNVGVVLNLTTFIPEDEGAEEAAHHMDGIMNRIWLDPLAGRGFPSDIIDKTKHITDWSFIKESELALIAAPIDWLGINYYSPTRIASTSDAPSHPGNGQRPAAFPGTPPIFFVPRGPLTEMGWEVHPESLISTLKKTQERLPDVPLYITENGGAFPDRIIDGHVDDLDRVDYYARHLDAALTALEDGVDLRGYFAWSLMDNLEWAEGWTKRFGLFHVNNVTQVRTPKTSAHFYRELLARR